LVVVWCGVVSSSVLINSFGRRSGVGVGGAAQQTLKKRYRKLKRMEDRG
jgi:hypothetical protein